MISNNDVREILEKKDEKYVEFDLTLNINNKQSTHKSWCQESEFENTINDYKKTPEYIGHKLITLVLFLMFLINVNGQVKQPNDGVKYNDDKSITFYMGNYITFDDKDIDELIKIFNLADKLIEKYKNYDSQTIGMINKVIGKVNRYDFILEGHEYRNPDISLYISRRTNNAKKVEVVGVSHRHTNTHEQFQETDILIREDKLVELLTIDRDKYYKEFEQYKTKQNQLNRNLLN